MPIKKTMAEKKSFKEELLNQMVTLFSSGFGLVAALAWNEAIQGFVKEFIEPRVPGSGVIYRFVYAILITVFVVLVTYQLAKLTARFQKK